MPRNSGSKGHPGRLDHGRPRRGRKRSTYSRQGKGRRAEVYDRPAIDRAATGAAGQASHKRGKPSTDARSGSST